MKKLTLTAGLLLALTTAFAQTLIPRAGVTFSGSSYRPNADFAQTSTQQPMVGFTAGVGYDIFINDRFSVVPEINFVQKGMNVSEVDYPDGYEYKLNSEYKLNYLEVPVLVKLKFGGVTKFYVNAGPSVALGLGGTYKFRSTFGGLPLNEDVNSKIKFADKPTDYDGNNVYIDNRIDAGIQVGAGAVLFGKVNIDVRYTTGVTNLINDTDFKNRVIAISLGVPLNLF